MIPSVTDLYSLGATGQQWLDLYTGSIHMGATATIGFTGAYAGNTGPSLTINADLIPTETNIYSLGATDQVWREMYIGPGTINIAGPSGVFGTIGTDNEGIIYTKGGFASPSVVVGPSTGATGAVGGWEIGATGVQGPNYNLTATQHMSTVNGGLTGPAYSLINVVRTIKGILGISATLVGPTGTTGDLIYQVGMAGISGVSGTYTNPSISVNPYGQIVSVTSGGSAGPTGSTGPQGPTGAQWGNVLTVDSIYGNDATGQISGSPYRSVTGAINALSGNAGVTGYTIHVLPGTYSLGTGITIPPACAVRGISLNTVILTSAGGTSITMGATSRLEDVTLNVGTTGTSTAIYFPGTTPTSAKVRACLVTASCSATGANIYGVYADGTGSTTFNTVDAIQRTTVNVTGVTGNTAYGLYVNGPTPFSLRDTVFSATATGGTGIGAYVDNSGASVNLKTSTFNGSTHDIKQTWVGITATSAPVITLSASSLANANADANGFATTILPMQMNFNIFGKGAGLGTGILAVPPGGEASDALITATKNIPMLQRCTLMGITVAYLDDVAATVDIIISKTGTPIYRINNIAGSALPTPVRVTSISSTFTTSDYLSVGVSGPGHLKVNKNLNIGLYFY